jgi:hypothetical protein
MTPITDDVIGHTGAAGIIVAVIEFAKRSNLPLLSKINANSTKVIMAISAFGAALATLGFQAQWTGVTPWEMFAGAGGQITLTIPPDLPDLLVRFVGQMIWNMGAYHAVKPAISTQ